MKTKAFTLVELLVVISIIALLIAILVPSLQAARLLAKSMICLTHLRNLGTASNIYAPENEGFLPPYGYNADGELRKNALTPDNGVIRTHMFVNVWGGEVVQETRPGGTTVNRFSPMAAGFLYTNGYIDNPATYYCPLRKKDEPSVGSAEPWIYTYQFYDEPWGTGEAGSVALWLEGEPYIASSYFYNCHAEIVGSGDNAEARYTYPKLDEYPPEKFLAIDMMLSQPEWCAHTLGGHSWNVVHADGHARNVMSEVAIEKLGAWHSMSADLDVWRRWQITFLERAE